MPPRALAVLALAGCAQLAGLDETTKRSPDAATAESPSPGDAAACLGGDARATDPATGACYLWFAAVVPRDQARAQCAALGARLASIQSAAESTVIVALLGMNDAYLGASDEAVEGTFQWEDGTPVALTNWYVGEPNNGAGTLEEDCVVIHGSLGGQWDDRPCAPPATDPAFGAYPFLCERD